MSAARVLLAGAACVFIALAVAGGVRAYELNEAYQAALVSMDRLRPLLTASPSSLSPGTLAETTAELRNLNSQFDRIDRATTVPGLDPVLGDMPWVGPRYRAARNLVEIGLLATDAATTATEAGSDLLPLLDKGGLARSSGGPTWLDALLPHQDKLAAAARDLQTIRTLRAQVDDEVLPTRLRTRLGELDRILARSELQALASVDISAAAEALGASRPARYLVLFQNPAELRPTGGFPGTAALVTVDHGVLDGYQFFDVHELTEAYIAQRSTRLPQPWAQEQFFPQDGFLLHDALWWPDFPRSARQLMTMYAATDWPRIDGVIAIQPEVASNLVSFTGSFEVEFDGERHTITAENVYQQIERERRLVRDTPEDRVIHKNLLGLIGKALIEHLKSTDRKTLGQMVESFATSCGRRDVQVYVADPAVEAELDRIGCTGRLDVRQGEPTLAVTYANVALAKTSLDMRPRLTLTAEPPRDGQRRVRLDIDMRNGAVPDEDPVYQGFQRWWVEVSLPQGSTLLSDPGPMANPEAPNGGGYLAALFPRTTGTINVEFSMPDTSTFWVRRQPGVRNGDLIVRQQGCTVGQETVLDRDTLVDLASLCNSGN